jgi:hypothetical protein
VSVDDVLEKLKKLQNGTSSIAVVHKEPTGHTYVSVDVYTKQQLQDVLRRDKEATPAVLTAAQQRTVSRLEELIPADEYQAGVIEDSVALIRALESQIRQYRDSGYRRQ